MLVVLCRLECAERAPSTGNRKARSESQNLYRLCSCVLELAHSRKGRSQEAATWPEHRNLGDKVAQQRERLWVLLEHVMRVCEGEGSNRQVERIESHGRPYDVDRPL